MDKINSAYVLKVITERVGRFGEYSAGDPYQPRDSFDTLRRGGGTPKGFRLQTFAVEIEDSQDPRLTLDGLNHIGYKLRLAAETWLAKELEKDRYGLIGSAIPDILVTTRPPSPVFAERDKERLWICVKVYVYPRLNPDILSAPEGEPLK